MSQSAEKSTLSKDQSRTILEMSKTKVNHRKNTLTKVLITISPSSDPLSQAKRSERMSRVRGTANKSTEMRVAAFLIRNGVRGWKRHPAVIPGRPDFFFAEQQLAVFVDGCFWHCCPYCRRNMPRNRNGFWRQKIRGNRMRDIRTNRLLRSRGFHVLRIWEHALRNDRWSARLMAILARLSGQTLVSG